MAANFLFARCTAAAQIIILYFLLGDTERSGISLIIMLLTTRDLCVSSTARVRAHSSEDMVRCREGGSSGTCSHRTHRLHELHFCWDYRVHHVFTTWLGWYRVTTVWNVRKFLFTYMFLLQTCCLCKLVLLWIMCYLWIMYNYSIYKAWSGGCCLHQRCLIE